MSELQFDKAETEAPACFACKQPLTDEYYEANGQSVCPRCREALSQGPKGSLPQAVVYSLLRGGVVGMLCAGISAAITHFSGWELGIVWIFCGAWIGSTIQTASEGRGGWLFKLIALVVTYFSIGLSLALQVIASPEIDTGGALGTAFAALIFLVAGPVIIAVHSLMSLLIYGFGLFQATVPVQKVKIEVTGPYRLKPLEPAEPEPPAPLP